VVVTIAVASSLVTVMPAVAIMAIVAIMSPAVVVMPRVGQDGAAAGKQGQGYEHAGKGLHHILLGGAADARGRGSGERIVGICV
jgi:hypothetical protein